MKSASSATSARGERRVRREALVEKGNQDDAGDDSGDFHSLGVPAISSPLREGARGLIRTSTERATSRARSLPSTAMGMVADDLEGVLQHGVPEGDGLQTTIEESLSNLASQVSALAVRVDAIAVGSEDSPRDLGCKETNPYVAVPLSQDEIVEDDDNLRNSIPRNRSQGSSNRRLVQEARKEARQELTAVKLGIYDGKATSLDHTSHASIRAHLSSFDRALRYCAISSGSPTCYFLLLYSLSEKVRNRVDARLGPKKDYDIEGDIFAHFRERYRALRSALLTLYLDPSEASRLRQKWHDLRMTPEMSFRTFVAEMDRLETELALQGDVLTDNDIWDKLTHSCRAPFDDWALTYRLAKMDVTVARSYLESRANLSDINTAALSTTAVRTTVVNGVADGGSVKVAGKEVVAFAQKATPNSNTYVPDVRRLQKGTCGRCYQAGHLADKCMAPAPSQLSSRCLVCGRGGHKVANCRLKGNKLLTCKRCGVRGHVSFICRNVKPAVTEPTTTITKENNALPVDPAAIEMEAEEVPTAAGDDVEDGDGPRWLMTVNSMDPIRGLPEDSSARPLSVEVELKSSTVSNKSYRLRALLDTGAARSFIRSSARKRVPSSCIIESRSVRTNVTVANGSAMVCSEAIYVTVCTPHKAVGLWLLVADDLSCDLILGMQALRSLSLMVYLSDDEILLRAALPAQVVKDVVSNISCEQPIHAIESNVLQSGVSESSQLLNSDAFFELCSPDSIYSIEYPLENDLLSDVSCPSRSIRESMYEGAAPVYGDEPPGDIQARGILSETDPEVGVPVEQPAGSPQEGLDGYGIPWVSAQSRDDLTKTCSLHRSFEKDRALVRRLEKLGLLSAYSSVFERYEAVGAIVRLKPGEYPRVASIIDHFPVLNPNSQSSPVRPVLNGLCYKGVVGSGQGSPDRSALGRSKRGILPSIFAWRAFPYVAILDLECAFYMLENDPASRYWFCLVWKGEVYRLRGPPMGSPHSPACLNDALRRLVSLARHKLPDNVKDAISHISDSQGSAHDFALYVYMKPYMDDVVIGSGSHVGLESGLDAFLRACIVRGFNSQERKRQLGPPPQGHESHVLGLDWLSNDRFRAQKADVPLPPLVVMEVEGRTVCNVTCRDILAVVNAHFDPIGSHSNLLLAMRYTLRSEISKGSGWDDFVSIATYREIERLMQLFTDAPTIPRLLVASLADLGIVYLFADSSMYAVGSVLLTTALVFIRGRGRLIPSSRMSWSIVRKELTACDDVMELFTETIALWKDTWLPTSISPTPILYTDSECNFYRIRRELEAVKADGVSHKATLQLPAYERRVIQKIALALHRSGGNVRHIPGGVNPADPYSRGIPVRCPFDEDVALREAVMGPPDPVLEALCVIPEDADAPEDEPIYEPDPRLVDSIRESQANDDLLRRLLSGQFSCDRERRLYRVVDGAVRHAVTNALIVPSSRCREIISLLHELFVHIGYYKIYLRTYKIFYCGPLRDYRRHERSCRVCIANRAHRTFHHELGRSVLRSSRCWELISCDFVGPFRSPFGNHSEQDDAVMVLLCIDSFSGYLIAEKCPNHADGLSTLKALQSVFYSHGFPLIVVSDQDQRFADVRVSSWLKACGVHWYRTPPHCERAHGWYETLHKTFLQIVRALLIGDESRTLKWFDVIDRAMWTINHVYRHSADSAVFPAELHFCYGRALPPTYDDREMSAEAAKFVSTMSELPVPNHRDAEAFMLQFHNRHTDCMQLNTAESIDRVLASRRVFAGTQLARQDFKRFRVGDYVVRYNFNRRGKLDSRWLVDQVCQIVAITGSVASLKIGVDWQGRPILKSEFLGNLKVVPRGGSD